MERELLAGVGRVDITPPLGVDLMGTSRRARPADQIYEPLVATCLVLSDGEQRIAVLHTDLLSIANPTADEFRTRVAAAIGAPKEHVLLNSTHSHAGPMTSPGKPKTGGDQERLREEELAYIAYLGHQLAGAARLAVNALAPARLAAGKGRSDLAANRRLRMPDGRIVHGRNFAGPVDREVGVIRVDTRDGRPLAAIVNFASHPGGTFAPHERVVNAGFAGPLRRVVEQATGATCLFLQGAAGNVNPVDPVGDVAHLEKVGRQIGCEASRVFLGIRTQPVEERVSEGGSIAAWLNYEEIPLDVPSLTAFGVRSREFDWPLMPLPSLGEAEAVLAEREAVVQRLRAEEASPEDLNPPIYHWLAARRLVEAVKKGGRELKVHGEVQAIRVNDVALVAVPGEAFVEMALAVKAKSPIPNTFFLGYSNGAICYLPTREAYAEGGYEVEHAYRGYGLPTPLQPGLAEHMVEVGLELLGELAREPAAAGARS